MRTLKFAATWRRQQMPDLRFRGRSRSIPLFGLPELLLLSLPGTSPAVFGRDSDCTKVHRGSWRDWVRRATPEEDGYVDWVVCDHALNEGFKDVGETVVGFDRVMEA